MRHVLLRFNYGVEIGARLAYLGHFKVTGDPKVLQISKEEKEHGLAIEWVLSQYGLKPFFLFNWFFYVVGNLIRIACHISPRAMLDWVASTMELFAVFNYRLLAKYYPDFREMFLFMAEEEDLHRKYFKESK